MPFSERPYVRGYSNLFPQAVKWLLIANVAIFVTQFLFRVLFGEANYNSFFGDFYLSPRDVVDSFAVWQLVTYLFLHDPYGFMHILFNMLMLWMFGNDLEQSWGSRFFLKYYFICGVGAGICVLISAALFRDPSPTIGASGAIYGLLMAYGMMYPDRQVLFLLVFPIKAKYFVMILGGIAFLYSLGSPGSGVSHVAHLGGMIFGYFYLRSNRPARSYAGYGGGYAGGYSGGYGYGGPPRKKRTSPVVAVREWYREWKRQRARRKFEVYLRKHDRDRDRSIH